MKMWCRRRVGAFYGAAVVLALAGAAFGQTMTYIVESRAGGQNHDMYSEDGIFSDANAKSGAPGCTPGINSRYASTYFSVVGKKEARFSAVGRLPATGTYRVYTTWANQTNRKPNIRYVVTHDGGQTVVLVDQSQAPNQWVLLGEFQFTAGTGLVTMDNTVANVSGNMNSDSVGWEFVAGLCDPAVPYVGIKPAVLPGDTKVIVTGVDPTATKVTVYANGVQVGENTSPGGTTEVEVTVSPALVAGAKLYATQTVAGKTGCEPADARLTPIVGDCAQIPAVTVSGGYMLPGNTELSPVLAAGATKVRVTGLRSDATAVKVYSNGLLIGTNAAPAGASAVDVNVTALTSGATISATQTLPGTGQPALTLEGCVPPTGKVVDACEQVPNVTIVGIVGEGQTALLVNNVHPQATLVKVYAGASMIGSAPSGGASLVSVPVTPLVQGNTLRAAQVINGIEGCTNGPTRTVTAEGMIEDFEGTVTAANDPPASGGAYRTWYDASHNNYTDVRTTGTRTTLFGSKCLNIWDHGWSNGAYAIFEKVIPETGTYHLVIDMLIDEPELADPDFYSTYQVGVIVNGTHRPPDGSLPAISGAIGVYPCLTPYRDGLVETEPIQVRVASFTANAGDDLLIAFATDVSTWSRSKSAEGTTSDTAATWPGMKIDNIRLVRGEKPPLCTDVPSASIVATPSAPLEAGGTIVSVRNIEPAASLLKVMADGVVIGSVAPAGAVQVDIDVAPLQAGQTLTASQTVNGLESCQCPGAAGLVVGSGKNSPLKVAIGIRETGQASGTIGADGGITGNIEWVGASGVINGAPQGKPLPTGTDWQEITFAWPSAGGNDPVLSFNNGNGVVDGAWGTLEHIAITIDEPYNTGRYVLYVDSIYNGDTVLCDFDDTTKFSAGSVAMFRAPANSGTTAQHLMAYPNYAGVDASRGADGSAQSYRIEFQFVDSQPRRWVRLTTVDDASSPDMPVQNPLIDLSKPITIKFMLYGQPACGDVFADADGDGDVDMLDFAAFQRCQTIGAAGGVSAECSCFDRPFDGVINADDLASFDKCASGANVPADPACDD